MVTRTIRDIFSSEIDSIWVDEKNAYEGAKEFLDVVMPRFAERTGKVEELGDAAGPIGGGEGRRGEGRSYREHRTENTRQKARLFHFIISIPTRRLILTEATSEKSASTG